MHIHKHLLILLSLLWSCLSFAQTVVKTPFYFPLQEKDYTQVLTKNALQGTEQSVVPQIVIPQPYNTQLLNTALAFNYQGKVTPVSGQKGVFDFVVDISKSDVLVQRILTDAVITQQSGNVIVTVTVKGECSNVKVTSASALKVAGRFSIDVQNSKLITQMGDFTLSGAPQWAVKSEKCVGPVGYQAIVEKEIHSRLSDNTYLKTLLAPHLQKKVLSLTDSLNTHLMSEKKIPFNDKIELSLTPQSLTFDRVGGQVTVSGHVQTKVAANTASVVEVPTTLTAADTKAFKDSGLLIPQSYIEAVNKALYQAGVMTKDYETKNIAAFTEFMQNGFYKWFVWPDLMQFPNDANFQLRGKAAAKPTLTYVAANDGAVWWRVAAPVRVNMLAPDKKGYVPYVNFDAPMDLELVIQIYKNKIYASVYEAQMGLSAVFDKNYVARFNPNTMVGVDTLAGKIKESMITLQFGYDLPTFEVDKKIMLAPKKITATGKWVQLVYGSP